MNKKLFFGLFFAVFGFACFSQNSEKVSELLESENISKGQAAYFVCVYQNITDENILESDAFSVLSERNLFDSKEIADEKISLSKACFLIARAANMKGGIFYSIFKTKRYAFREFKALEIVPKNADPQQDVSGAEFLALLNGFEQKGKKNGNY